MHDNVKYQFDIVIKNSNLIVRDHQVHGVRIMPGVTFLDMICRFLRLKNFPLHKMEMRNFLFIEPISTTESFDQRIHFDFEKVNDFWKIAITSQKCQGTQIISPNWEQNATLELHFNQAVSTKTLELKPLIQSAKDVIDLELFYDNLRNNVDIRHRDFMKGSGKCYVGEYYVLVDIHLSPLAQKHLKSFYLHPAYLDTSTFFPHFFHQTEEVKPYIPFHIGIFRAFNRLEDSCFVYVQKPKSVNRLSDVLLNDYEIFDANGQPIAAFEKFSVKKIRSKELISKLEIVESATPLVIQSIPQQTAPTPSAVSPTEPTPRVTTQSEVSSLTEHIQQDLKQLIQECTDLANEDFSVEQGFYDQGLDSHNLLTIVKQLENKLGEELYPTLLFEYSNIQLLAEYLAEEFPHKYQFSSTGTETLQTTQMSHESPSQPIENELPSPPQEAKGFYFQEVWKTANLDHRKPRAPLTGVVLLFDVNPTNYQSLLEQSSQKGKGQVIPILVKPGTAYQKRDRTHYEINPERMEDYQQLLSDLQQNELTPTTVIHFWSRSLPLHATDIESYLRVGIRSLLFLSQAWIRNKPKETIQLLYLYQTIESETLVVPFHRAINGFAKTLRTENPKFVYRTIEVPTTASLPFVELVWDELENGRTEELDVRYQAEERQIRQIQGAASHESPAPLQIKPRGTYLITGGIGGLGLIFGDYLSQSVGVNLVLVGRSPLNSEKEAQIQQFRSHASEVVYIQTDLSKKSKVSALIAAITHRFGRLDGVIHSAGVVQDAYIIQKSPESMQAVLAPKIQGTLYLDEATKNENLDFFMVFSSLTSIIGNPGQSDYAYANRFLDSFTEEREALRLQGKRQGKSLCINWPLWENGGLGVDEQLREWMRVNTGTLPISNADGIEAFNTSLQSSASQLIYIKGEEPRVHQLLGLGEPQKEQRATNPPAPTKLAEKTKTSPPVNRPIQDSEQEAIAVIGLSGRYPMAEDLDEFWDNLTAGKDCITVIPETRWDYREIYHSDRNQTGKSYSKYGGFLNGVDQFDPLFFNISPKDAEYMDPQVRLFLEIVWQTLEDAGYTESSIEKEVGVFVGVMWGQYQLITTETEDSEIRPMSLYASIANRISYNFNFTGPSIALDTMCSSSLTAVHLACDSIKKGESRLAIAGGVNLSIHPSKYIQLSQQQFFSTDGRCRSFGEGGDGYVPGEGVGAMLLKPLKQAIASHDNIYGIIKGTSINAGGRTSGFSVPSPTAQAAVILKALNDSGVDPRTLSYLEAHGTGTSLGDPIEIQGLIQAFKKFTSDKQYCAIGSVKSNIGHLESAAGVAGITKILLQMKHRQLVPSLHSDRVNPNIDFTNSPFQLQHDLTDWNPPVIEGYTEALPLRAGISSFGAGGSNAHVILEAFPSSDRPFVTDNQPQIYVISAKNEVGLKHYGQRTLAFLNKLLEHKKPPANTALIDQVQDNLSHLISEILGIPTEEIDCTENFIDLGLDPLKHAQFISQVNHQYQVTLTKHQFSYHDSIQLLSVYLQENYPDNVTACFPTLAHDAETDTEAPQPDLSLSDMAYTTQVGRVALDERLAIVAADKKELKDKLEAFLSGQKAPNGLYTGNVKDHRAVSKLFVAGDAGHQFVDTLITNKELHRLAQLWVNGFAIDWKLFHQGTAPKRVSLPSYPFEKKRYWVAEPQGQTPRTKPLEDHQAAVLHPLLHQNTTNLFSEQRYSSNFKGTEFFLSNHVINGQKVLPGVAHIEMARAAIEQAMDDESATICLNNISWIRPITMGTQPVQVHIELFPEDNGTIGFQIYGDALNGDLGGEPLVYSQGTGERIASSDEELSLNLEDLRAACQEKPLSGNECYERYRSMGLQYGPAHQGIQTIYVGKTQILAELQLPQIISETIPHYGLHPSLLDSALHACIGLPSGHDEEANEKSSSQLSLPFGIERLEVFRACTHRMWAWVRHRKQGTNRPVDIDLCDDTGQVCVRIKGLRSREIKAETSLMEMHNAPGQDVEENLMLAPVWEPQLLPSSPLSPLVSAKVVWIGGSADNQQLFQQRYPQARVMTLDRNASIDDIAQKLEQAGPIEHLFWISKESTLSVAENDLEGLLDEQNGAILQVFRLIKALTSLGYDSRELGLSIITIKAQAVNDTEDINPNQASIHGLIGSLAKEYINWNIRLVDLPDYAQLSEALKDLVTLPEDARGNAWAYRQGQWFRQQLLSVQAERLAKLGSHSPLASQSHYRFRGVYVIIGGAGGIGEVWSEYVIRQYQAQVIWLGRREADASIEEKLDRLAQLGPRPAYFATDATQWEALQATYQTIKSRYNQIHGVIHSAIVLQDKSLASMDEDTFQIALKAKVDVSIRMAQVFKPEALDFVAFFSSMLAFIKAPGQSNYAAGCIFKDAFAHQLSRHWDCSVKVMNWGYWGDVGAVTSTYYKERMAAVGVGSIETEEGMLALETLLESPLNQIGLFKFTKALETPLVEINRNEQICLSETNGVLTAQRQPVIQTKVEAVQTASSPTNMASPSSSKAGPSSFQGEVTDQMIKDFIQDSLFEKLSDLTKVGVQEIDSEEPFSAYGLDSITGVNLVQTLNNELKIDLVTTSLFDFTSIDMMVEHIFVDYKDTVKSQLGAQDLSAPGTSVTLSDPIEVPQKSQSFGLKNKPYRRNLLKAAQPVQSPSEAPINTKPLDKGPIAVIGMSGRFAKSQSVDELWEHLAAGTDLVGDVTRWDLAPLPDQTGGHVQGSLLDDIDQFDPMFFKISGLEATYMDPQQRLCLEESWNALEDAGYAGESIQKQRCGVYIGCCKGDYYNLFEAQRPAHSFWGNEGSIIPARIAYYLDLRGPAIAIDTACSSSLVAIHLACQGLWSNEIDLALGGGVSLQSTPGFYHVSSSASMLSPTGRCHTFDQQADGFVPGEGVGVLVLKRLEEAIADGDYLYGVIKGSAINQDGVTNGITAPSALSQERLEREVYDSFNIHPEQIQMVEAHGSGTKLGDPIEFGALTKAFRKDTDKQQYCAIGSIKTNVGHTLMTAGVAGAIKVLLALKHKQIPPSLHFHQGNSAIDFEQSPFYVNTELTNWTVPENEKRAAAVSSFGFSGTNAHVVIEEAPVVEHRPQAMPSYLMVLSARTEEQLRLQAKQLVAYCETNEAINCGDMSFTLLLGRKYFDHRLACVVRNQTDLITYLSKWLEHGKASQVYVSNLSTQDSREQASLKSYGNQCIEACQQTTDSKSYLEHLSTIGELFIQGYALDFEKLFHPRGAFRRTPLPTYPFVKERYWVSTSQTAQSIEQEKPDLPQNLTVPPSSNAAIPQLLEKGWLPSDIEGADVGTAGGEVSGMDQLSGTVLILANKHTLVLAESLCHTNGDLHPVIIEEHSECVQPSPAHYWMDFSKADHGKQTLEFLLTDQKIIGLIDLSDWAGHGLKAPLPNADFGKMTMLQGLIKHSRKTPLTLLHFTKGLQTFKTEVATLKGASFAGVIKTLNAEYREVFAKTIDLDLTVEDKAAFHEILEKEWFAKDPESEACYRAGKRYLPSLQPIATKKNEPLPIDPQKVFVITGGTGGIGFEIANYLAEKGVGQLVLMGVQELPLRKDWQTIISASHSNSEESSIVKKLKRILALEEKGVDVILYTGALDEQEALSSFFQTIRDEHGAIGGVFHCAGVTDQNRALVNKTVEDFQRIYQPKMEGLATLHQVFEADALDFFILFSSVSAWVPSLATGFIDYSVANAYMNHFAKYQFTQGNRYYQSIVWSNWEEVGMGYSSQKYLRTGLKSLYTHEGLMLLEKAMACREAACVMPCLVDPHRFDPQWLLHTRPAQDAPSQPPSRQTKPAVVVPQTASGNSTTIPWLQALFSKELQIPENDLVPNVEFADFGVDSIILAELVRLIDNELGSTLDPTILFENSTIQLLAEYLDQTHLKGQTIGVTTPETATKASQSTAISNFSPPETLASPTPEALAPRAPVASNKVAVVGIACHFPRATNKDEFWENLAGGVDCITEIPPLRWDIDTYYSPTGEPDKSSSKWGGFIQDIDYFDPSFFHIKEETAPLIDPLMRQALEISSQTINDAGYEKAELAKKAIGVFFGSRLSNYAKRVTKRIPDYVTGTAQNFIAANISHFLNFTGPNLVVDTACSSSLVSIDLACKSLLVGDCEMALAGGVDILLDEETYIGLSESKALSVDGKCFTFDERANGFVPGEGCGAVLLKPLEKAIADGNQIYTVIEATATNNDGRTMGSTTPNPKAQQQVVKNALEKAQIDPATISYLETHGTGTMIGDPIELQALNQTFGKSIKVKQFCAVGSVKSNIGHLFSAAGIASFIKVALSMHHQQLVPTLNCETPNPRFSFVDSPFYPNTELKPWEPIDNQRIAGISSFGFGGTNAHILVSDCHRQIQKYAKPTRPPLPLITFNKKRYWLEPLPPKAKALPPLGASEPHEVEEDDFHPVFDFKDELESEEAAPVMDLLEEDNAIPPIDTDYPYFDTSPDYMSEANVS